MSNGHEAQSLKSLSTVSPSAFAAPPLRSRDISLTVERGEFVTFLGPSGCGKSTLLKLVSGLSPVSEGKFASTA